MKFTIVFPSHESSDLSIGCVFNPCLTWKMGALAIDTPHPGNPHYLAGDFQNLICRPEISVRLESYSKNVVVVVQPIGHGSGEYLDLLVEDIRQCSLEPIVVHMRATEGPH